jgi:predicted nucleic acid-binding protein
VIAYVDSSVLLRFVLLEEHPLREWPLITQRISSVLLHIECRRRVDRARLTTRNEHTMAGYRNLLFEKLEGVDLFTVTNEIIAYASQAYPLAIRSLDAIHLATALDWQQRNKQDLAFATHDGGLASAARAVGFRVLGAPK